MLVSCALHADVDVDVDVDVDGFYCSSSAPATDFYRIQIGTHEHINTKKTRRCARLFQCEKKGRKQTRKSDRE